MCSALRSCSWWASACPIADLGLLVGIEAGLVQPDELAPRPGALALELEVEAEEGVAQREGHAHEEEPGDAARVLALVPLAQ